MDLPRQECFLAVSEEFRFGRAAQRLPRSPASVGEAVAALEHAVGGALFSRTSRRAQLTGPGRWSWARSKSRTAGPPRHTERRRSAAGNSAGSGPRTPPSSGTGC
ncbi:helix-turn-helix domain-containing protein [Streptomyces cinereospinus]|uniref:LysR family transcriptional regulator n=1 Tax=Streptomyces cinereospinus TaxID=285561 RepID=A0ABV5N8P2_9ACTN